MLWVQKYADLVDATGAALNVAGCGQAALAWLSTDRLWERHPQKEGAPLHTGTRPFLDRLWPRLAASKHRGTYAFGTAVHPYDGGIDRQTHNAHALRIHAALEGAGGPRCCPICGAIATRGAISDLVACRCPLCSMLTGGARLRCRPHAER